MPDPSNFNALHTQELLTFVRNGDHDAWREVYRRYRHLLSAAANKSLGGVLEDSEDVLQSAFLSAWKDIKQFDYSGQGSFRAWLRTIVVHKNIEKLRKSKRAARPLLHSQMDHGVIESVPTRDAHNAQQDLEDGEARERLLRSMETRLTPIETEVLTLRLLEQFSTTQVSEIVELEPAQVRRIYRRAMKEVAESLGPDPG